MATIIPTCETAVSALPEWHRAVFNGKEDLVTSSAGWSPGALNLAQGVAMKLHAQLLHNEMTRLLIDLSKDPTDPARWSEHSMTLTEEQREKLDQRQKSVYLNALEARVENAVQRGETAIHISFDTRPDIRDAWVEIEYDLRVDGEAAFARSWRDAMLTKLPNAVIRDVASPTKGLGAFLRKRHPGLLSLRFSAAQSIFLDGSPVAWTPFKKAVIDSIHSIR
ncbi:N-formylglutamate amidohydrolase [Haloferula helveola]|uniref:N-formylglutamate amidohydrolase n=1 Tax=Haloferula helveola TaxID=490095 RepID=A0ABN6H8W8_9BACT|nr:N-formylglutamate amidohydrolase [Haloferula helveola]